MQTEARNPAPANGWDALSEACCNLQPYIPQLIRHELWISAAAHFIMALRACGGAGLDDNCLEPPSATLSKDAVEVDAIVLHRLSPSRWSGWFNGGRATDEL